MDYIKLGNTGLDVSRVCLGFMGWTKFVSMQIHYNLEV